MFKTLVWVFFLVLLIAYPISAVDIDNCKTTWGKSCESMRISICPKGDFEYIRNSCGGDGDYIWVEVRDHDGNGVSGIPWTDYWFGACVSNQELLLCCAGVVADSLTNENGRTTISTRIAGGGCVITGGLYLAVQGKVILEDLPGGCSEPTCIGIVIVSPDLDGNGNVDLTDFGIFTDNYDKNLGDPGYNPCCDFNDDDACNVSDFAFFVQHYTHECW